MAVNDREPIADLNAWARCPDCPHQLLIHDVSGDPEDPRPMCCADGCGCGKLRVVRA